MRLKIGVLLVLAVVFGFSGNALASGFALAEQSVSGLGNAFAGGAAAAEDASTVFHNPAGMTRLEGKQVVGALHVIIPKADFKDLGSVPGVAGLGLGTNTGGDAGGAAPVPNFYYTETFDKGWSFGLGLNAPFGLSTEYEKDWIGRYHGVKSAVQTININPSAAHKVNDKFSYGFGVSIQYLDAELSNAVDFGLLSAIGRIPAGAAVPQGNDGFTNASGDSWGFGYNFGFLYEIDEKKRLGFSYRSKISHDVEGDVAWTLPADVAVLNAGGLFTNGGVKVDIELPSSAQISYYQDVNDKLAVMADIQWTEWTVLDNLVLNYADNTPNGETTFDWDDTMRYSLGVSYQYNDQCKLRAGLAFDETPIPNEAKRGVRVPGEDRTWFTLGGHHVFSDAWSLDAAYAYIMTDDPVIDKRFVGLPTTQAEQEDFTRGLIYGEYDATVNIVSVQLNYNF